MVRRLGNQVIVIMLLLFALLGLSSGVLAAETRLVPIKIDRVDVQVGDLGAAGTAQVKAHVVGYYGACSGPVHEPVVSRQGNTSTVTILVEYTVEEDTSCIAVIRPYDRTIDLGLFVPGSYTLRVNDYTTTFTIPGGASGDVMGWPLWPTFAEFFGDGQANAPERIPGRLSIKLVPSATPDDIAPTLALVHGHVVDPERFSPNFRWITVSIPPGTEDPAKLLLERDSHVEFVEYVTPRYPA